MSVPFQLEGTSLNPGGGRHIKYLRQGFTAAGAKIVASQPQTLINITPQTEDELTLAQGPGIHTAWTWPVSCLCPPSKTAAGSHGGGCSCQTLVEQLSQDHLLPADKKQKWHATENDPPILISFLELTYYAKPPEYESGQKHTHTEDTHIQFWVGGFK